MAYVDGELDGGERAEFERQLAADPDLRALLAAEQTLRARLQTSFARQLSEPAPERLVQTARTARAGSAGLAILERWRGRSRSRVTGRRYWPLSVALAASLMLAAVFGLQLWRSPGASVALVSGQVVARGPVAQALSTALARTQPADAAVRIGLSFRDRQGRMCRTFMARAALSAGVACRAGQDWLVEAVASAPAAAGAVGAVRTAGSEWPAAIMREVDQRIAGNALDDQAERRARAHHWQP
ncbi:MAG: hypothetical protein KGJ52_11630 [Gammaproteobacteria bacterium]|nr:hypothetical protein [Gammaproteobacteria bacterium]